MADVRLVGVHKSYGDAHVLRDIDLEIRDGEVRAVQVATVKGRAA